MSARRVSPKQMNEATENGTQAGIAGAPVLVFCRSRASACAIARITNGPNPYTRCSQVDGRFAEEQQDDAEHRLDAGDDLGHRQPGPEPVTRASADDPGAQTPDPPTANTPTTRNPTYLCSSDTAGYYEASVPV